MDCAVGPRRSLSVFHDRPKLELELGPFAGKVHTDGAGGAELRPQLRLAVEIEVDVIRYGADVRRRGRQMHEGQARQVCMDDLVHLGIGADLEKLRKLMLDLDQRPTGRDLGAGARGAEKDSIRDGMT